MKNLKMMMGVVLTFLGIKAFSKDDAGAMTLDAEQKGKLKEAFGEKFAESFAANLPTFKEVELTDSPTAGAADLEGTAESLMNNLREHNATLLANGLKDVQAKLKASEDKNILLQKTVDTLASSPEDDPQTLMNQAVQGKAGVKKELKIDASNPFYAAALAFLSSGNAYDYSAATIEVGDLKTEFGKYLSQNGNNLQILKKLFTEFTSAKFFTTVMATTEWRAVKALITSVSMQFTNKWTPGGKTAFKPLKIVNRRHKINYPIIPSEVLDSYMFHMYDEGLAPDQMPITLYIWNTLIYPALLQDIEMRMIWKGKFVDHEATQDEGDAATPPEDSMDGLETIIVEAKISGATGIHFYKPNVVFNWKTATAQEVLDFVNGFVDWLSPFYKTKKMPLFISDDNKRIYKRAYKDIWGSNSGQDGDFGSDRVDYSNQMLTAPDGMFNSPIIFSTPKENMIKLRHKNEVPNVINDVQKHGYEVRLFGEYWLAVGFAMGNAVFAYSPTGYNPKAQIEATLGGFDDYQEDFMTPEESSEGSGI